MQVLQCNGRWEVTARVVKRSLSIDESLHIFLAPALDQTCQYPVPHLDKGSFLRNDPGNRFVRRSGNQSGNEILQQATVELVLRTQREGTDVDLLNTLVKIGQLHLLRSPISRVWV